MLRFGRRLHHASTITATATGSGATARTAIAGEAAVAIIPAVVGSQRQLTPAGRHDGLHRATCLVDNRGGCALSDEAVDYSRDLVSLRLCLRRADFNGASPQIMDSLAPPHALHRTHLQTSYRH